MANPGYPMQPMMQQPPPGAVVRQGTSKAVPVVVSAGLAIGVFCGLLFGLGTGDEAATAATTTSTATTTTTTKPKADVPEPFQPTTPKKDPPAAATVPAAGSNAAKPAAGSGSAQVATTPAAGSGSAAPATVPPAPAKLVGKLTIAVKPDAIAKTAKIFVDGKQIEGNLYEADLTDLKPADPKKPEVKKAVKVLVKASGYSSIERSVDIVAAPNSDNNNTFEVELSRRASTTTPTGTTTPPRPPPPGGNKPKCKKPPCGLIDI